MEIELLTTRLLGKIEKQYLPRPQSIIQGVQMTEGQPLDEIEPDILYIGPIADLNRLSESKSEVNYLCICTPEERAQWKKDEVRGNILFWGDKDARSAYICIQNELISFSRFRSALSQRDKSKTDKDILTAAGNFLKKTIFFFGGGRTTPSFSICNNDGEALAKEVKIQLKCAIEQHGEFFHDQEKFLYYRVRSGRNLLGTLVVACNPEDQPKPILTVLAMVADALILIHAQRIDYFDRNSFSKFLESVVTGEHYSIQETNRALMSVGWKEEDFFFLYKIAPGRTNRDASELNTIGDEIRMLPLDCRYFIFQDALYLVINRTRSGMPLIRQIKPLMLPILAKHDLFAGICNGVLGFSNLAVYSEQCDIALKFGKMIHPNLRYYQHVKYMLYHMISTCSEEENIYNFVHPAIRILHQCDCKSGTEYVKTLASYVTNDRVITKTADDLHVHRNTLNYRLDKIHNLTHVEFETEEETLYIMVSCCIINYLKNSDEEKRHQQ